MNSALAIQAKELLDKKLYSEEFKEKLEVESIENLLVSIENTDSLTDIRNQKKFVKMTYSQKDETFIFPLGYILNEHEIFDKNSVG